ncbi:50S ribosomal protein L9 [Bacteroidetes/Chlorobi group bacterium ChocPot_Mid]|nr:MAG: 50S ribosomal protein L9 [Bacteroidetes/Chlorobi group bacterium ChocPot_Mid]
MKVILRQDVDNLGQMGSIVNVKPGYARNYLIPRELAYHATPNALRIFELEKKQFEKIRAFEKADAEKISAQIADLQISIPMKVGEEGRLYGSVTSQMIAQELELRGYEIDKRQIIIEDAIKTLGVFDVKVRLHTDITANLKIWVISEE